MKFTIERSAALDLAARAREAVPNKPVSPALGNFLVRAEDGTLSLEASDLDIAVRVQCPAEVEDAGVALLAADRLYGLLRNTRDDSLRFVATDSRCSITGARTKASLPAADSLLFPTTEAFSRPPDSRHEADSADLACLIDMTLFAASEKEGRFTLNGVVFHCGDGFVKAVATDHRVMAACSRPAASVSGHSTGRNTHILPSRAAKLLRKLLAAGSGIASLAFGANDLVASGEGWKFRARLLEGRYPDYRVLEAIENPFAVTVNVEEFGACVRQAAVFPKDGCARVFITVQADGSLTLEGNSPLGDSLVEMPSSGPPPAPPDGPVTVCLDSDFLTPVLSKIAAEAATFTFRDPESPVFFKEGEAWFMIAPLLGQEREGAAGKEKNPGPELAFPAAGHSKEDYF